MNRRYQFILLPILGALAGLVSFLIANPYVDSLVRPNLPITDPAAHFTTGTKWDTVVHFAFGALLCGSFAFALCAPRLGFLRALLRGLLGALLGGANVFLANYLSDVTGIQLTRTMPLLGGLVAPVIWCGLVPSTIAIVLLVVVGWTPQRIQRAFTASVIGFVMALAVQYGLGPIIQIAHIASTTDMLRLVSSGNMTSDLRRGLPMWQSMNIAIGLTMGFLFAYAENFVRKGAVRLIYGRNEFREWNLDEPVNRIGSAEGIEIPVRGFDGVAPVHAQIVLQNDQFFLESDPQNPAYVNGYPVHRAPMNHMDVIQVGAATLIFGLGSASLRAMPAIPTPQTVPPGATAEWRPLDEPTPPTPQLVPDPSPVGQPPNLHLIDSLGNRYPLPEGLHTVGRDPGQTISLTWETSVSRQHASLAVTKGLVTCTDLQSTNGTRRNGELVQSTPLNPGDTLQLGQATLRLSAD